MSKPMKPVRAWGLTSFPYGGELTGEAHSRQSEGTLGAVPVVIAPAETWDMLLGVAQIGTRALTPEYRKRAKAALKAAEMEP